MNTQETIAALSALAQETRLAIFRRLVVAGSSGRTPGELSAELSLANATLSFHLKELVQAGLLCKRQEGRFIHYQVDFAAMNALVGYLTENCCQGEDCGVDDDRCCVPTDTGEQP